MFYLLSACTYVPSKTKIIQLFLKACLNKLCENRINKIIVTPNILKEISNVFYLSIFFLITSSLLISRTQTAKDIHTYITCMHAPYCSCLFWFSFESASYGALHWKIIWRPLTVSEIINFSSVNCPPFVGRFLLNYTGLLAYVITIKQQQKTI